MHYARTYTTNLETAVNHALRNPRKGDRPTGREEGKAKSEKVKSFRCGVKPDFRRIEKDAE